MSANLVEILITAKDLTGPAMASVNAKANAAGKGMAALHKTALLAGAGFAAVGVEAVKMASKFDSEMALLQTQAGVSKDKIAGLKQGVLDLAGKVGQSPDSLAEALFHVESNFASMGISSSKALALTETAAKGATVGHADLVDVTNALTAAVASGIPGVQNFDQAMGVLNATVGAGDMKMQDLANAFGSGMVATVKGFGLNITDVGAALATFGDNNIRGALAGNQLRQSVMALAKPIAGGAATLRSIGLQTDTLAKDMQRGGLKLALEDLVAHMKAAGISSKEQGAVITEAFGRKAGAGLNILVGQMDRLESKYPEISKGAKTFSQSWEDTKKTFAFQMKSMQTGFEALMIGVGQKIIPPLQSMIGFLKEHKSATIGATEALGGLLAATVAVSVAMKAAVGAKLLWSGLTVGARAAETAFTLTAVRALELKTAFLVAGGGVKGLAAAFGTLSKAAKVGVALAAVGGLVLLFDKLSNSTKDTRISVDDLSRSLESGLTKGSATSPVIDNLRQAMKGLVKETDDTASAWDKFSYSFTHWGAKFSSSASSAKAQANDFRDLGKAVGQIAQDKGVDAATKALAMLTQQGAKIPTKYLKDYNSALADAKIQSDITAESQGRFGAQAQQVQQDLQAQQDVVDGLVNSLQALDKVNQDAYDSQTKFEDSIANMSKGLKENGRTLNVLSEGGRKNRDLIAAEAAATDDYTAKLDKQNASWDTIDAAYKRGHDNLVKFAEGAGYSQKAAEKLANSLIHMPAEIKVKGNISDIESKLAKAKKDLASAPKSKQVAIRANISQLENELRDAQARINSLVGTTVIIRSTYVSGVGNQFHEGGDYPTKAKGGKISGPGSGTSDDVLMWGSNGEFVMTADATKKNLPFLEAMNSGKHGIAAFAKGGLVSSAEQDARNQAMGGLGLSYFGYAAGYRSNAFQNATGNPGSVGDLVSSLNQWVSSIRAATHGAQESKLVKAFDKFGVAALRNEKALITVNSQLDGARSKLSALKDSFGQLKDSVSSSIVSFGSIANHPAANALGVVEQMQGSVNQAKRFADDLARLKKQGLNAQSLSELASAGVDSGLGTADALAGASPAYIKRINDLEKQLKAAGGSAGNTAADAMYGAGIKAADGIVKGLEKQQKRLDDVMARAAAAMAAELKRAFGRKASGGTVGAAATGGNRWGRTLVGEYQPEIVDLPVGSRVHSGPDSARMLAGGGGALPPLNITLMIGDRALGDILIDPLRRTVRTRGGNVQAVLGT